MKIFIFLLCVGMVLAVPPLVPSQIDGHVLDAGQPVIGATVRAYIDANGDGDVDSSDELIAETTSLDLADDADDGYFRIMVAPGDYSSGETDLVLIVEDGTKKGSLSVKDIVEGTSFDNDVTIQEEKVVQKSSGGGHRRTVEIIRAEDVVEPNETVDDKPNETVDDTGEEPQIQPQEPQEPKSEEPDTTGSGDNQQGEDTGTTEVLQDEPQLSGFQRIQAAVLGGGVGSWMSALLILAIITGLFLFAWKQRKQ